MMELDRIKNQIGIFKQQYGGQLAVFGGFLIHLVLGCLYLWPLVSPAVTAYLRGFDSSITYHDTIMVYASAVGTQGISMLFGGYMEPNLGPRTTLIIGSTILVMGTFLASQATTLFEMCLYDGVFLEQKSFLLFFVIQSGSFCISNSFNVVIV